MIAGFGRVGQMLADLLSAQEIPHIAIEGEADTVKILRREGRPVHYGDASSRQVLDPSAAPTPPPSSSPSTTPKAPNASSPKPSAPGRTSPYYARARDGDHARRLHAAGAAFASPDLVEAALQLGEALLEGVGVPDEIARRVIADRQEKRSRRRRASVSAHPPQRRRLDRIDEVALLFAALGPFALELQVPFRLHVDVVDPEHGRAVLQALFCRSTMRPS